LRPPAPEGCAQPKEDSSDSPSLITGSPEPNAADFNRGSLIVIRLTGTQMQDQPHDRSTPSPTSPKRKLFDQVRTCAEFLSLVAVIVATPIALLEFHHHNSETASNNKKERIAVAETTYRDVDAKYSEFMGRCLGHPRLDCYSVPVQPDPPLSKDEEQQQKILYSILTDVFEVAYVQYRTNQHELDDEVKQIFAQQWQGWDAYIRKFLRRPAYCRVYLDIRNEYDTRLTTYMNEIATDCSAPPK